jgi:hypothetical protein
MERRSSIVALIVVSAVVFVMVAPPARVASKVSLAEIVAGPGWAMTMEDTPPVELGIPVGAHFARRDYYDSRTGALDVIVAESDDLGGFVSPSAHFLLAGWQENRDERRIESLGRQTFLMQQFTRRNALVNTCVMFTYNRRSYAGYWPLFWERLSDQFFRRQALSTVMAIRIVQKNGDRPGARESLLEFSRKLIGRITAG